MALLGQIRLALPSVGRPLEKERGNVGEKGVLQQCPNSKLFVLHLESVLFFVRTILQRQTYETSYAEKRRVVQVSIFARFFA